MYTKKRLKEGFALITVLVFISVFLIITVGVMSLVNAEVSMCEQQINSTKAFFLAESGIERLFAKIIDNQEVPAKFTFKISDTGEIDDPCLAETDVIVTSTYKGDKIYQINSSTKVKNSERSVNVDLRYQPPAKVFDYALFLNDLPRYIEVEGGEGLGMKSIINGDVRSNGIVDSALAELMINGDVYAGQWIGEISCDDDKYDLHPYSPLLPMPNLQNLSTYEEKAWANNEAQIDGSTIKVGETTLVNAVFDGNIILIGTESNPLVISGPVVIRGDVVIKGTITGQGTIYAGRNIYVANSIEYANGPTTPRPPSDSQDDKNTWVDENANKDIVGFVARESIVVGDYTKSGHYDYYGEHDSWYANAFLFQYGKENDGRDLVPNTGDEGEGDDTWQEYEDFDGDGVEDFNYSWSDVETQVAITEFANSEGFLCFSDVADNPASKNINGIFYTNHFMAGNSGQVGTYNGAIIARDQVIDLEDAISLFQPEDPEEPGPDTTNNVTINYDERINSRHRDDPNWLIDLDLPLAEPAKIVGWWEG